MNNPLLKTLCLGDSYTFGEGVRVGERWPTLWLTKIRAAGFQACPSRVIARTGWTTDELAHQIAVSRPDRDYDLVTLMIGVNNQYRGRPLDEFSDQFAWLLEDALTAAQSTPTRCLTISIPDWSVTPFVGDRDPSKIAREIDEFNRVIQDQSREANVCFLDVTGISRETRDNSGWLADDGLHPGPTMHRIWSELIADAALQQLAKLSV